MDESEKYILILKPKSYVFRHEPHILNLNSHNPKLYNNKKKQ